MWLSPAAAGALVERVGARVAGAAGAEVGEAAGAGAHALSTKSAPRKAGQGPHFGNRSTGYFYRIVSGGHGGSPEQFATCLTRAVDQRL